MGSVNFSGDCTFIELYKSACIHKSAVSKIFEINFFDLQKWIFQCSNFMTVSDPLFLFKKFRYIFINENCLSDGGQCLRIPTFWPDYNDV